MRALYAEMLAAEKAAVGHIAAKPALMLSAPSSRPDASRGDLAAVGTARHAEPLEPQPGAPELRQQVELAMVCNDLHRPRHLR